MKGLVFKEFISLVEENYGDEVVEEIIADSNVKSEGAYTTVGTYDYTEILSLVTHLSLKTTRPASVLVKFFGKNLAKVFIKKFPQFFEKKDTFEFLKSIDSIIHVEVKKLYSDAELPRFKYQEVSNGKALILDYISTRPFADLAEGLIEGVIEHFKENVRLECKDLLADKSTSRRFIITMES